MKGLLARKIRLGWNLGLLVITYISLTLIAGAADKKDSKRPTIEDRIQQLEAKDEIRELLARFVQYEDSVEFYSEGSFKSAARRVAELFAKDGELEICSAPDCAPPNNGRVRKGTEALFEVYTQTPHSVLASGRGNAHVLNDIVIELSRNEARATARWTMIAPGGDGKPLIPNRGSYHAILVRENRSWRFKRLVIVPELPVRYIPPSASR